MPRSAVSMAAAGALALAIVALPGCAAKRADSRAGKPIVLWIQMDPEERARFDQNLETYRSKHPGIDISYVHYDPENLHTQYQSAASGGGGPQILFGASDLVGPLSLTQLIRPLDTTMPAGFFDRFVPQALDTLDGHLYATPDQVGNHLALCYNKKLVPKAPETTDEFIATAKRLTKGGAYGFAMNLKEPFWLAPFFGGFGGWVMDERRQPTLDSPAMTQALAFLRDLKAKQGIMPAESDYEISETLFKEGKAAMIINGPWSWSAYRKAGIDLGIAPIFKLPNGRWAQPMVGSKGYSINANVKDDELPALVELITYLTSPEAELKNALELGILPSHKQAYDSAELAADPIMSASRQIFALGRRMPVVPEMRVIWDVMRVGMQEALSGATTPEKAAKSIQAAAVQQIAGMRQ
jgi:maltose-binding protein MalE